MTIIDLSTIDHETVIKRQRENRIRLKLNKMTVARLRAFTRRYHIPIAGASTKQQIVSEIMSQYGHVWHATEDEIR